MKILLLDIEVAPNLAHTWGLFKQTISINQLLESGYTLCWAAKWYGEKDILFDSLEQSRPLKMLKGIHKLVAEADVVVHYNGTKFDMPILNKEFLLHGLPPPAPYLQIDLFKTVKSRFRFPSNKLDYIVQELEIGAKVKHSGHELWIRCMSGDEVAWREMERYNRQDVKLLEKLYEKLKPWIKNHPNHGLYRPDTAEVCPNCGSESFERRGFSYTATCVYQRYRCYQCNNWFRGTRNIGAKAGKKHTQDKS